jgi:hypothetical protein
MENENMNNKLVNVSGQVTAAIRKRRNDALRKSNTELRNSLNKSAVNSDSVMENIFKKKFEQLRTDLNQTEKELRKYKTMVRNLEIESRSCQGENDLLKTKLRGGRKLRKSQKSRRSRRSRKVKNLTKRRKTRRLR